MDRDPRAAWLRFPVCHGQRGSRLLLRCRPDRSAIADFIRGAADHPIAGLQVAHHFDESPSITPLRTSTHSAITALAADDERALGGRDQRSSWARTAPAGSGAPATSPPGYMPGAKAPSRFHDIQFHCHGASLRIESVRNARDGPRVGSFWPGGHLERHAGAVGDFRSHPPPGPAPPAEDATPVEW